MSKRTIVLEAIDEYPCQWDDLINVFSRRTYATIYTLDEAKRDPLRPISNPGITRGKDGILDIVVDVPELTKEVARNALKDLSKITKKEYYLL